MPRSAGAALQQAGDKYAAPARDADLAAVPRLMLASNLFQCILTNVGGICEWTPDLGGGGGWFPTGTPDVYIYESGFQVAGLAEAGPWAGDTVAALFYDGSLGGNGTALTPIYDSLDPDDLANWPDDAYLRDEELFAPALLGRKTISQNDTWVRYWDGNPSGYPGGLAHPMGIRATQRTLAWNYPSGNESVLYVLVELENVTNDPEFQRLNELAYFGGDDALPDEGWAYREVYTGFTSDYDVSTAFANLGTAILPFDMVIAYHGLFQPESEAWRFPASVFYPPFFTAAPGIAGTKYLQSPRNPETGEEIGLSMASIATYAAGFVFPLPDGPNEWWRYLSGNLDLSLGDPPCNVPAEIQTFDVETTERSVCFIPTATADVRVYQASGPFSLEPGESVKVVVAHIVAPTVETMPDGSPSGVVQSETNTDPNLPGVPSFHPGYASARGCDPNGANCTDLRSAFENPVKSIERAAGWVEYRGPGPSGGLYPPAVEHPSNRIEQREVEVVPGSLLGRALVAQTIFDNRFLLGFSPEPPPFYLVPGDGRVTVVWSPSATETEGDPFIEVTGDPESALYNPNYREFDVEGYRIWRGTARNELALLEQFDFADTRFLDYTCETVHPEEDVGALAESAETGNLVPVIGYAAGEICPATPEEPLVRAIDGSLVFNNGGPGGAPGAGISRMPTSAVVDTAILADRDVGEVRRLSDTGVPYVYTDTTVTNNFTYFYAVTAFDVNSMASGPHSLRSSRIDQAAVPRAEAPNLTIPVLRTEIAGDDGVALDPGTPHPRVDPDAGTFDGPVPPTDGVEQVFAPLVERLLPAFTTSARIDSVKPDWVAREGCGEFGWDFGSVCFRAWLTIDGGPSEVAGLASNWNRFGRPASSRTRAVTSEVPFDPEALETFGIPALSGTAEAYVTLDEAINFINWEGQQNRRGFAPNTLHGGPRWFSGTEETTPDPTRFIRVGHLPEVDSVWIPIHHTPVGPGEDPLPNSGLLQYFGYYLAHLGRAADIRLTWRDGTVSVRDVTHHVDVPFSAEYGSSWGFLNEDGDGDGIVSWLDFFCVGDAARAAWAEAFGEVCPVSLALSARPALGPVSLGTGFPTEESGTGFALYLNGMRHFFLADAPPPDGTVWTLRTYSGTVTASTGLDSPDPGGYAYQRVYDLEGGATGRRSPLIPGLTLSWVSESRATVAGPADLRKVHTVPDPYLVTSRFDRSPTTKQLMFVNLPPRATIRIYTLTGVLVDQIEHDDPSGAGRAAWNLRNRSDQFVASGVYFFHIVTPERQEKIGKFTVLMGAQ